MAFEDHKAELKEAARFLPNLVRLTAGLVRDKRVPRSRKVGLALLAAYLASPIDLIPDFIPVLGVADDIIIAGLTLRWVMKSVPPDVVREHWHGDGDVFALMERVRSLVRGLMHKKAGQDKS